jgi:hypothetical protein
MMETVIDIYELTGTNKNKAYTIVNSDIKAWILPASNESIALYDNMAQGQEYEFRIVSDTIDEVDEQSKFIVVDSQVSGFAVGDEFITIVKSKRQRVMGKFYLLGMCHKA